MNVAAAQPGPVYLPATADRPAEPAPYVLTAADVCRLARLDVSDVDSCVKRFRLRGWLRGTKIGNDVRYLLPDALDFLARARAEDER